MRKIVHSGLFVIGVLVFSVIFDGVVLYLTWDEGKASLAMATPVFLYLSTICFWPKSEDGNKVMPSRSNLIVCIIYLILCLYLLVLELFVETWRASFLGGGILFILGVVFFSQIVKYLLTFPLMRHLETWTLSWTSGTG